MKKKFAITLCLAILLSVAAAGPIQPRPLPLALSETGQLQGNNSTDQTPTSSNAKLTSTQETGERKFVAYTSDDERDPAVEICSGDQYLVAYERNGDIYGQFLDQDADTVGTAFIIFNGTYTAYDPDVACEWTNGRFIVVWAYDYYGDGSDMDVYSQAVYAAHQSSDSQLVGTSFTVSGDGGGVDETSPAIACNHNEQTCLVAFEFSGTGNGDVYGQRLSIGVGSVSHDGDRFKIGDYGDIEIYPDVAWGGRDDEFLIVWQWYDEAVDDLYHILYVAAHDTEQGAAVNELSSARFFLISPGDYGGQYDYNQQMPAVAYNPNTQKYMANFSLATTPAVSVAENFWVGTINHGPYKLNNYVSGEAAIAYSGGPVDPPQSAGVNQFLVASMSDTGTLSYLDGIVVPDKLTTTPLERPGFSVDVLDNTEGMISNCAVTGSPYHGDFLVIWERDIYLGSTGADIYAQMIPHLKYTYLPIAIR